MAALVFDVKLVVPQKAKNLCGLLHKPLRINHEKCPTT
jgi:hypothetical protein